MVFNSKNYFSKIFLMFTLLTSFFISFKNVLAFDFGAPVDELVSFSELEENLLNQSQLNKGFLYQLDSGYYIHFYWNSNNSSTPIIQYNNGQINVNIATNSYPPFFAQGTGDSLNNTLNIAEYYNNPIIGFYNSSYSSFSEACQSVKFSDDSFSMVDVNTNDTCTFINIPQNDSIDYPYPDTFLQTGEALFSGGCINNGTNNYLLTLTQVSDVENLTGDISCVNYQWSKEFNIIKGIHEYYLYNFDSDIWTFIDITGYDSNDLSYFFGLKYPELDNLNHAKVVSSDSFPFRFNYILPNEVDRDSITLTWEKCDSNYLNCENPIFENSPNFFDSYKTGYFEINEDVALGKSYYILTMLDDNTSTVKYSLKFVLEGVSSSDSSAQTPFLPDRKDLGYWGNLLRDWFVPPYGFFNGITTDFYQTMRIQFNDFFTLYDTFNNAQAIAYDSHLSGSFVLDGTSANFNIQPFSNVPSYIPVITSYILYLTVLFFLIRNVPNIFS